jgi:hypothetical protein
MSWISVRNWRKFQHYDPAKRQPPWIKVYNELLDEDAYASLTLRQRGLLHGIWMAYARSRCGLRVARVGLMVGDDTVRIRDIEALNHAGFIDIVASKTLAEGYHDASARAHAREVEVETEEPPVLPTNVNVHANGRTVGLTEAETADRNRDEHGVPIPHLDDIPF